MVEGRQASKTRARGGWIVVLALMVLSGGVGLGEDRVSFQDIEESLTCQCGCGLTVHSCNHLQCPSAIPLREEIRAQMDAGKDKAAILAYFSDKYGEKILSAPTAVGFNVVAWVAPFVVVGLGGVFLAFTLKRWSGRSRLPPSEAAPPASAASPYSKILEKELKDFDA
jgi:cytochrome c-type biogenesis protein CcmH